MDSLGPAAERLRAEIAGAPGLGAGEFADWKRKRRMGRAGAWLATIALVSPGAICLVAHAPGGVSALVEALGIGLNWWLRRLRRNHITAIRAWEPGQD